MSELTQSSPTHIAPFAPQEFRTAHAKLDALIAYAAEVKDWPLLDEAIDAKLDQQGRFIAWWGETIGKNWGGARGKNLERGSWSTGQAEAETGVSQQQVSRWGKSLEAPDVYREKLRLAAYRKAGLEPEENHRAEGTGDNEWFTPAAYIEAAREVMGGIDLDPATHLEAQKTVQATAFFTRADDGLSRDWRGNVWLNPPYAPPHIGRFVTKLVSEFCAGNVAQAVLLTHNYTDTAWFHEAQAPAALLCFTRGRIRFVDLSGDPCSPTQGQTFFYFGSRGEAFRETFSRFGFVR